MSRSPVAFSAPNAQTALGFSRQLLLVITSGWSDQTAQLQRFERTDVHSAWQPVGASVAVALGKSGLAWGRGLHPQPDTGPQKREGDGCAPAGIYAITALFGYASSDSPFAASVKLPYLCATRDLKCIDDPASAHYNCVIDQSCLEQNDWTSCEDMLRNDQRYTLGAVVAHNNVQTLPGAGSCIFLHVWENEGVPTAGCTAMSLEDMNEVAAWLDGAKMPLLVQLPLAEYKVLGETWMLPEFDGED